MIRKYWLDARDGKVRSLRRRLYAREHAISLYVYGVSQSGQQKFGGKQIGKSNPGVDPVRKMGEEGSSDKRREYQFA